MSNDQKELILNMLGMITEEIQDLEISPLRSKAQLLREDLYQVMKMIDLWSEGR